MTARSSKKRLVCYTLDEKEIINNCQDVERCQKCSLGKIKKMFTSSSAIARYIIFVLFFPNTAECEVYHIYEHEILLFSCINKDENVKIIF